ncbi:MAG: hypothetical protein V2A63_00985 [Patescibacteria group bacterium]
MNSKHGEIALVGYPFDWKNPIEPTNDELIRQSITANFLSPGHSELCRILHTEIRQTLLGIPGQIKFAISNGFNPLAILIEGRPQISQCYANGNQYGIFEDAVLKFHKQTPEERIAQIAGLVKAANRKIKVLLWGIEHSEATNFAQAMRAEVAFAFLSTPNIESLAAEIINYCQTLI